MAQLRRFDHEFQRRNVRILLICFAQLHWAKIFLEETQAPYPLLMDPEMESYRAYGLRRSVLRTYLSPATLWLYSKAILTGRRFPLKARGDPHQMGGDFLVGRDGRLLFAHPSREPADRPSVEAILEAEEEAGGRKKGIQSGIDRINRMNGMAGSSE